MRTSKEIRAEIEALSQEVEAILEKAKAEDRDLTDEENARIEAIQGTDKVVGKIAILEKQLAIKEKQEAIAANQGRVELAAHLAQAPLGIVPQSVAVDDDILSRVRVPLSQRNRHDRRCFADERTAYASGQFLLATLGANNHSRRWCHEHGVLAAHSEGDNTKGGYLVPDFFETSIIRIVEDYGVFRRNTRVYPMGSDSVTIPRRTGGFTVYYVGENASITTSDMAFTQVRLTAKKPSILTQVSSELSEDEVVGLANLLTLEFGFALANAEDSAGFNGDGTSTYGGIVGLKNALLAGSVSTAATGNTAFSTLDLLDFHNCKALLPAYSGLQPKWYISSQGFAASMEFLAAAAGGNTISSIQAGMQPTFLGSPVVFSQVLPTTLAAQTSAIVAYYGDLSMATTMGTRRGMRIATDASVYFASDALAVRCTERYDVVVNETGTASVAGPLVALKMASS